MDDIVNTVAITAVQAAGNDEPAEAAAPRVGTPHERDRRPGAGDQLRVVVAEVPAGRARHRRGARVRAGRADRRADRPGHPHRGRTRATSRRWRSPTTAPPSTSLREQFAAYGPDLDEVGIAAVGHRVVHGGPDFSDPVIIDDDAAGRDRGAQSPGSVAQPGGRGRHPGRPGTLRTCRTSRSSTPPSSPGCRRRRRRTPSGPSWPPSTRSTSTASTAPRTSTCPGRPPQELGVPVEDLNMVIFHLGNGASASAVRGGRAIETSMGLTPLQGLVMGTRSGDIDPSIYMFLHNVAGMSIGEIDTELNKQSGLKGLCGDNDFRVIEEPHQRRRRGGAAGARRLRPPAAALPRRVRVRARPAGSGGVHRRGRREQRTRPGRGHHRAGALRSGAGRRSATPSAPSRRGSSRPTGRR